MPAANVVTKTVLQKISGRTLIYFTLFSDGLEADNVIVYNATTDTVDTVGTTQCFIDECWLGASWGVSAKARLMWDATTPITAMPLNINTWVNHVDFREIGGLPNVADGGKTGNITLNTTGLTAGDTIMILLKVKTKP